MTVMHLCQLPCCTALDGCSWPFKNHWLRELFGKVSATRRQCTCDCRLEAATEKGVKVELPPNPFVIKV